MRVVTSLELGGPKILQEFWMAVLKVWSRNKEHTNNQEQQHRKSRTNHRLMKKRVGSIQRSIPVSSLVFPDPFYFIFFLLCNLIN